MYIYYRKFLKVKDLIEFVYQYITGNQSFFILPFITKYQYKLINPILYKMYYVLVWVFHIEDFYAGYIIVLLIKCYVYFYVHQRLYRRMLIWGGEHLNVTISGYGTGLTYFERTCTLRKKMEDDIPFEDGQDFRRDTDTNFQIKQNTCRWSFDEQLIKKTDCGYYDDNNKFVVLKTFEEIRLDKGRIVDLELVTQLCTSKNMSMTCSPEVSLERFMFSTNMGPMINYNRKDIFTADILNNCARLSHCIALSKRNDGISTDIYHQVFRRGDSMRLIDAAQKYSLFY
jgi:hypothetical protein